MYISNIDWITLKLDINSYDKKFKLFLQELENKKKKSLFNKNEGNGITESIILNDEVYNVFSNGAPNHAYIIESYLCKMYFAKGRSKINNYLPIKIEISSTSLWQESPMDIYKKVYKTINWINENYNDEYKELFIVEKIKRIDLCCHTDKFELDEKSIECFQGRFSLEDIIRKYKKLNTYNIGKRGNKLCCRIYNKSLEIKERNKLWFIPIWVNKGLTVEKVWNIEFELDRSFLKDVSINNKIGLNTFDEIYKNLKPLWEYCAKEWLVHKNLINTRIERCPPSEEWREIQGAFNGYEGEGHITRVKQVQAGIKFVLPNLSGYFTSYAAMQNMTAEEAIKDFPKQCNNYYLNKKDMSLEEAIKEKRNFILGGETK